MATVTYDRAGFRTTRPSIWRVGVGVLGGGIAATVVLFPVGLGLSRLGVLGPGMSLLESPSRTDGSWATFAHLVAFAAAAGAAAVVVRYTTARNAERSVSLLRVWGIVLVTGFPPVFERGVLEITPGIAFLATVVLVHAYAIDARPGGIERALNDSSPGLRIGLLAAAAAAVVAAAAYGVTHPFVRDPGGFSWESSIANADGGAGRVLFNRKRGGSYRFEVRSAGPLHPRVTAAAPPPDEAALPVSARVTAEQTGATTSVTLRFKPADLRCTGNDFRFSRVIVLYRILGRTLSQPVRLDPAPTVLCR